MDQKSLEKLNEMAKDFLSGNLIESFKAVKFKHNCSVTIFRDGDEALTLNDVTSGNISNYLRDNSSKERAVARMVIGYSQVISWENNKNKFYYDMSMIVNNMLCSLTDYLGNLQNRQVTVASYTDVIFWEMTSISGLEFRISVT